MANQDPMDRRTARYRPDERARCPTTESPAVSALDEDLRIEATVLWVILDLYPATLTLDELIRARTAGSKELPRIDPVQRAIRELVAHGLLHRPGEDEVVRPTRAAVRFFDLMGEME